jgi:hypothetical protein
MREVEEDGPCYEGCGICFELHPPRYVGARWTEDVMSERGAA